MVLEKKKNQQEVFLRKNTITMAQLQKDEDEMKAWFQVELDERKADHARAKELEDDPQMKADMQRMEQIYKEAKKSMASLE